MEDVTRKVYGSMVITNLFVLMFLLLLVANIQAQTSKYPNITADKVMS